MSQDSMPLNDEDVVLFQQAADLLQEVHDPVIHQVAAALRTRSGNTYRGIHLGSRRINVCAESSAIANAEMALDHEIEVIVAVCKDDAGRIIVTNPCGVCRELLTTYGKDTQVLVDLAGIVRKVPASALLPEPWLFPHENEWTVEDPSSEGST